MKIDYAKIERAKELLEESGATYMVAHNDVDNHGSVCVQGNYIILKSLTINAMAQLAGNICNKYGEEAAARELLDMMTKAAQKFCAEIEGDEKHELQA